MKQNFVIFFIISIIGYCKSFAFSIDDQFCNEEIRGDIDPGKTLISCESLDEHFVECEDVTSLRPSNETNDSFCPYFGTSKGPLVYINVRCMALPCIECAGLRHFQRKAPCLKYTNHYYITALLYSIFLGVLAVDRFYLGYSAIAVGKLMTLGGLGVWWIADIVLLLTNNLKPANESEWQPYY